LTVELDFGQLKYSEVIQNYLQLFYDISLFVLFCT